MSLVICDVLVLVLVHVLVHVLVTVLGLVTVLVHVLVQLLTGTLCRLKDIFSVADKSQPHRPFTRGRSRQYNSYPPTHMLSFTSSA